MAMVLKYRGRILDDSDVGFIRSLIQAHPAASRRQLSEKLCGAWNWVQPNGAPCDMVCRGLMLALNRGGHIQLPPVKCTPHNPLVVRRRPDIPDIDASVVEGNLKDLGPLEFRLVRRTPEEALFNGLIEHHHYLNYTQPVGAATFCPTSPYLTNCLKTGIVGCRDFRFVNTHAIPEIDGGLAYFLPIEFGYGNLPRRASHNLMSCQDLQLNHFPDTRWTEIQPLCRLLQSYELT